MHGSPTQLWVPCCTDHTGTDNVSPHISRSDFPASLSAWISPPTPLLLPGQRMRTLLSLRPLASPPRRPLPGGTPAFASLHSGGCWLLPEELDQGVESAPPNARSLDMGPFRALLGEEAASSPVPAPGKTASETTALRVAGCPLPTLLGSQEPAPHHYPPQPAVQLPCCGPCSLCDPCTGDSAFS